VGISFGTATPSDYKLGANAVSKIYVGSTQVWPVASGGSLLTIARDNGVSSFTGSGTTASPYTRAALVYLNDANGLSHYTFTANGSATVTLTWAHSDDDDNGNYSIVKKNGTIVHTSLNNATFTRTVSVVSSDVITLTANYLVNQMFSYVSVSAA